MIRSIFSFPGGFFCLFYVDKKFLSTFVHVKCVVQLDGKRFCMFEEVTVAEPLLHRCDDFLVACAEKPDYTEKDDSAGNHSQKMP